MKRAIPVSYTHLDVYKRQGYGAPSRTSKDGTKTDIRDYSRVIELDPVTLRVVWEFDGSVWGGMMGITSKTKFYSQLISSAQRLPNGNTLIDEGCCCRTVSYTHLYSL